MDIKNATVDGKIVDVVQEGEFASKWRMYSNQSISSTSAVEVINPSNGQRYILPFRGRNDDQPGIYQDGCIYFIKYPNAEQDGKYRYDNLNVVDYSNVHGVQDFLARNNQLREMETTVLTDIDCIYIPPLNPDDSPEMRAVKEAIISKKCDISRYAPRFGDNFLNDKRILKTSGITLNKLIAMCKKLDIEAELTLRNTSPDVANPMPKDIKVILTGQIKEGDD